MTACETCWGDAYARARMLGRSQAEHYYELLAERAEDHEQAKENPMSVTPLQRAEWRAACDGESVFHETRILALLDELDEADQQIDDHYDAARNLLRERDEALDRLRLMTREARLSRDATEKAVASRISRRELERALCEADAPEDSMATDDDLLRYQGRAEAVEIMRIMLELDDA